MSAMDWSVFLAVLLGLTVAMGVVVLLLEQPIRLERFGRTRILTVASLGLSTLAIFGIVIGQDRSSANTPSMALPSTRASLANVLRVVATSDQIKTIPANLTPPLSQVSTASNLGFPPTNTGCIPSYEQSTIPPCIFGDRSGAHTMVLYGDSHAGMWFQAFDEIASRAHWRLILMFKPACPAAPLPTHPPIGAGSTADVWVACSSWHRFAINRINQTDPDLLVVTQNLNVTPQGTPYTPAQWQRGMELLFREITAPKTKKLVLGDIPLALGTDCLARNADNVQACSGEPATLYNRAERRGAVAEGVRYINVTPWFCTRTCSPVIGGYDVYFDGSHVAVGYTRFLEGVLTQKLGL